MPVWDILTAGCAAAGANVNQATRSGGATALHRAAYMGHWDIVKTLYALLFHEVQHLDAYADRC
jgi:hypothetical protein